LQADVKLKIRNPKHPPAQPLRRGRRNSKWFDKLTTLSHVEGQYPMTKIQMTKTVVAGLLF